ncbi:hypothetical protein ASE92_14015 [Pedobacter sp. Leaf41]|jgi:hypothetical protein|uniref:hypothetical protein n=1 Tax=Pedobacter sp. Leaf41 TaxID=1736218 RepID=UPI0007026686|nr:hypothetical protein [Pedobacter sp. Leaf41]KQN34695.1 hypothetical protein ASE92_14015 [Pedobacter sp. Leaf41]RZK68169.1 MAG: hypothetical protein EOO95_00590 [Pedobacter sp.]
MFKSILTITSLLVILLSNSCKRSIAIEDQPLNLIKSPNLPSNGIAFKEYLGINAFEWDMSSDVAHNQIDPTKFDNVKIFTGVRHYLEWDKIEPKDGVFTFGPAHNGGWDYDLIYQSLKNAGKYVLIDVKSCPSWLLATYPANQRDPENVPAPYGLDRSKPESYIKQARAAFQLAARYGSNTKVDTNLLLIDPSIRWRDDTRNVKKVGLDIVKYIECDNERDKWWKGDLAKQSPEEYAANMSAFYDGHQGKLGKGFGVKNADPNMIVVMGGLADPSPQFVEKMIKWCEIHRGKKANGEINLCFDVINYHLYSNDAFRNNGNATKGMAPELSNLQSVANQFSAMSKKVAGNIPVWVTETGYDSGEHTSQRAIKIGNKSALITQADWNLRTALLYARTGVSKCIFYMLDNVDVNSWTQYTSSGFINPGGGKRPSADYVLQTNKLLGEYHYESSLKADPIVDVYALNDKKMYVLTVPDEIGRTAGYDLNLGSAKQAVIYTLAVGKNQMNSRVVDTKNGIVQLEVSETPIFVEAK